MDQGIPEWPGLMVMNNIIQNHKSLSLYDLWCLADRGVQYALLMRVNKPERAVRVHHVVFGVLWQLGWYCFQLLKSSSGLHQIRSWSSGWMLLFSIR